MSPSSASAPPAEWYLARDGQQFGPLSETELNKLVELGHLRPDDLLWRDGLADWQPAQVVLPAFAARAEPAPSPTPPQLAPEPPRAAYPEPAPSYPQQAHPHHPAPHTTARDPSLHVHPYAPAARPEPTIDPAALHHIPNAQPGPTASPHAAGPTGHAAHGPHTGQPNRGLQERRAPGRSEPHEYDDDDEDEPGRGRKWLKRTAAGLFFVATLSAAAWFAYPHRDRILSAVTNAGGGNSGLTIVDSASPVVGFAPTPQATDAALQKSQLWRVLKRDFPDWYRERIVEASELASAQKGDDVIALQMMQKIVDLRRRHSTDVLSASGPRLKSIASAFVGSLAKLRSQSVEACFGFISKGEVSTTYLDLLAKPENAGLLQTQLVAVFEAVAEGRKLPKVYAQPRQGDYNLVVAALEQRGWGEADLQLFSDSQRLAKAAPAKVCQLVTDWFEAQLSLKDDEAQLRLLVDALRPVVAG